MPSVSSALTSKRDERIDDPSRVRMNDRPPMWLPARPALFASSFHPHLGGVEEVVRQLALHQVAAGARPIIHTMRWPRKLEACEQWQGLEIRRHSYRAPEGSLRQILPAAAANPVVLGAIIRQLRAERAELVQVHCVSHGAWFAYHAARILQLPFVATLQGELSMDATDIYSRSPLLRHTLRLVLANADAVTACSSATLTEAEDWAGTDFGARARVVFNGVDNREFAADRASHDRSKPFVLALGRQVHQKGFDLLIAAFAQLTADPAFDWDLVLAGDGPEAAALTAQVARLGIAHRVRFVGRAERPTTVSLLGSAALFVLPSRQEPFGIVNLEAMAAGTPVVATRVGGVPEIVEHNVTGVLVPPEDPHELAVVIRQLWSNPDRRRDLARHGKEQAARFDWRWIEEQYREVYERARAHRDAAAR